MPEVLTGYQRVRSRDFDEACARVGEVFCPHRLAPRATGRPEDVRFNSVEFGAVGLSYLAYGSPVRIRPRHLSTFFLVQVPLAGRALVRTGHAEVWSDVRQASVPDPDADLDMLWEEDSEQLIVRIERTALERQLERLLGRPPERPLRLDARLDLGAPAAQSWLATVQLLRSDLDGPGGLRHPVLQEQTERLVMSQLLAAIPHTASAELTDPRGEATPVPPRVIRRADQLIADHAREALTVEDLAEAVGLSVRSLQEGFRRHLGTTPTARLREARLAGVRRSLLGADATRTTVSRLAADWGFHHLGRFAVVYREHFGESPSQTLRR
ncbi:AraC family transcriptional regulator [Amycolatopsis jejuensis]|uniref:AraC family transcriptional regulator n=1 Tax=Amycolatopsis jejuensis TaxID=330084 RepID=UPI0005264CFF|nr:AraC family transcriptional regulator [Amycolatopsis jejuensis]